MESNNNYNNIECNNNDPSSNTEFFFDRPFEIVDGGYYDGNGFYCTPDGSFWDKNEVYFNREGRDRHGGTYDKYGTYYPAEGWNEDFLCYEDETPYIDEDIKYFLKNNVKEDFMDNYQGREKYFKKVNDENFDEDQDDEMFANDPEYQIYRKFYDTNFNYEEGRFQTQNNNINSNNNINNIQSKSAPKYLNSGSKPENDENLNKINVNNNFFPNESNIGVSTLKVSQEPNRSNLNFTDQCSNFINNQ